MNKTVSKEKQRRSDSSEGLDLKREKQKPVLRGQDPRLLDFTNSGITIHPERRNVSPEQAVRILKKIWTKNHS
jgi:hypothetical protein